MKNNIDIEVRCWSRGAGKTTSLIKDSAQKRYPILVSTDREAKFIMAQARNLQLEIPSPLVYTSQASYNDREILVDEYLNVLARASLELNKNFEDYVTKEEINGDEHWKVVALARMLRPQGLIVKTVTTSEK